MAFAPFVRLVVRGTVRTTQSWSVGMSVTNDGTATGANMLTWLTTVDGLVKTWLGGEVAGFLWDGTTVYNRLSAYAYPAAGHSTQTASIFSSGVTGTQPAGGPAQLAQVYSIRTGIAGRKGRGRFYIPVSNREAVGTDGQLGASVLTTCGSQFKTFVDALNLLTIGSAPAILCVAGKTSGVNAVGTDLVLNSKVETQRRRQDKIASDTSQVILF